MCGRYVLRSTPHRIREQFGIADEPGWAERWNPRFNLAPGQNAPVVRVAGGARHLDLLRWGLVPSWADDPAIGNRLICSRRSLNSVTPMSSTGFASAENVVAFQPRPDLFSSVVGARRQLKGGEAL